MLYRFIKLYLQPAQILKDLMGKTEDSVLVWRFRAKFKESYNQQQQQSWFVHPLPAFTFIFSRVVDQTALWSKWWSTEKLTPSISTTSKAPSPWSSGTVSESETETNKQKDSVICIQYEVMFIPGPIWFRPTRLRYNIQQSLHPWCCTTRRRCWQKNT